MRNRPLPIDYMRISDLGYDVIREPIFNESHPEVLRWTRHFENRFHQKEIFERFETDVPDKSIEKAAVVLREWHRFSEMMPWFLCQAAALVSTNRLRHYVIQTAFEELGARDAEEIHHEMFETEAKRVGIPWVESYETKIADCKRVVLRLKKRLLKCQSDEEILGMLLGLEMPARENIETIFSCLAYSEEARDLLQQSKFFKLHRALEIEHIRLNVANFLRFCETKEKKERYVLGFDAAVEFWNEFWSQMAKGIYQLSSVGGRYDK